MGPSEEVGGRVRAGIRWTAIGLVATRLSRFAANVVLARLLAVEVFGVLAMANAAILLMGALREAGLGQAYVQRSPLSDERPREAQDTVFAAMLALNGLLFAVMLLLSPSIAGFFEDEAASLEPVLQAMAVLFLIDTFVATPQVVLQRRMDFGGIARAELAGSLVNATLAIAAAFSGLGVWALVIGLLGERLVTALRLAVHARWRPGLQGSWRVLRGLFDYGRFLWGYALVRSAGGVLDRVVVGKLFGATGLGGYGQAFNLCSLPATVISQLVNRVALPAMSRMRADIPRLRAALIKSLEHVAFLAIPMGVGLFAVSDLFVPLLYGEKWRPIVPLVDVLAIYGTVLAVASVTGPALQALGRPNIFFHTELLRHVVLIGLLLTFARRGEIAVAWSVVGALSVVTVIAFAILARLLQLPWRELAAPPCRSLAAAAAMACLVTAVRRGLGPQLGDGAELALAVIVGATSYPVLSLAINAPMVRGFIRTAREIGMARSAAS